MKFGFLFLTLCFLLASCLSKHMESLPISEEKLEAILIDIHVAESAMSTIQNGIKKDSLANLYYDQVAEIHKIDRETLDTCMAILERNPELTKDIYEKMSEDLDKKTLVK